MNIAIILAGGSGTRITNKKHKQLIKISKKPILIHTLSTFLLNDNILKIIIVCHSQIIEEVNHLIKFYFPKNKIIIKIIRGGSTRNDSLLKAFNYLNDNYQLNNEDVIITHDAVRMFVSKKIIDDSIATCKANQVVIPVIDETDSIFKFDKNNLIMIDRNTIKKIQTPQTLHYGTFKKLFGMDKPDFLNNPDWDLCWLSKKHKIDIININGSIYNLKITTDLDLIVARAIYKSFKNK